MTLKIVFREDTTCRGYIQQAFLRAVYTAAVTLGKELLVTDIRYSAWANHVILDACAALTAEEREFSLGLR